jgi:hypothetical protein
MNIETDPKNIEIVQKKIKELEAAETDSSKVRDSGFGFIIVKDVKVSAASKKLLNEMKKSV